ncbi:MAG: ribonuclease P protein component [bacterium]
MRERKTPSASYGFPRSARITRGADLQRIAREGKRIRTTLIEVRIVASPLVHMPTMRVGVIVARFKRSAVVRNRLKRRLRELVRLHVLPMHLPYELVIRARPEAYEAPFSTLAADMIGMATQLARWHFIRTGNDDAS